MLLTIFTVFLLLTNLTIVLSDVTAYRYVGNVNIPFTQSPYFYILNMRNLAASYTDNLLYYEDNFPFFEYDLTSGNKSERLRNICGPCGTKPAQSVVTHDRVYRASPSDLYVYDRANGSLIDTHPMLASSVTYYRMAFAVDTNGQHTLAFLKFPTNMWIAELSIKNLTTPQRNLTERPDFVDTIGRGVTFNRFNGNYLVFGSPHGVIYEHSPIDGSVVKIHQFNNKIHHITDVLVDQYGTFIMTSYDGICLYYPSSGKLSCIDSPPPRIVNMHSSEERLARNMAQTVNNSIYVFAEVRESLRTSTLLRLDPIRVSDVEVVENLRGDVNGSSACRPVYWALLASVIAMMFL